MGWLTGIVVYLLTWWVVLFAILPLWVTTSDPNEPGGAVGAPRRHYMPRKLALTSVIAAVIWVGIYIAVREPWFSFRGS
jgi:predicted secreted protein